MSTSQNSVAEIVRKNETDYLTGNTTISKYVDFNLAENINKIDAYLNSKHISGPTDSMGRDKPFFNIVTASTNIWYRATDIDRKNIRMKPGKREDVLKAFIAGVHLQEFMRKQQFGTFLNDWGRALARYGSAVVKFVESEGELHSMVIPWNRLIVDPIDFDNDVVIEVLEMTPAQLMKQKGYDQEIVDKLVRATESREGLEKMDKDNKDNFIKLYEVHGEMPLSYLTGKEEDEYTYVQQMHVISFVAGKEKGEFDDFCLVSGREKKHPYMITHLIKEDGRTMAIGAVENLFEAQWMVNHSQKAIKDQLDLASKIIFQTSDGNYVGRNALTAIETGDIMIHQPNQPLTQLNNGSHDVGALQSMQQQWEQVAKEINSTPDAIAGNTFPSGTAYRQVVALQQEAHSLFEIMTENKGLHLEDMMRKYIIPFLMTKMDTTEELAATLDEQGIQKIDSLYIPNEAVRRANRKIIEDALKGKGTDQDGQVSLIANETEKITKALANDGNQRFLKPSEITTKTWKDELEGFEWDVEVEVTSETTDKEATMTTLTTVLQTIAANPAVLQDPNAKLLFNKILTTTGEISPLELTAPEAPRPQDTPQQPVSPNGGTVDSGEGLENNE